MHKEVIGFVFNADYIFAERRWAGKEAHFLWLISWQTSCFLEIQTVYKKLSQQTSSTKLYRCTLLIMKSIHHHSPIQINKVNGRDGQLEAEKYPITISAMAFLVPKREYILTCCVTDKQKVKEARCKCFCVYLWAITIAESGWKGTYVRWLDGGKNSWVIHTDTHQDMRNIHVADVVSPIWIINDASRMSAHMCVCLRK